MKKVAESVKEEVISEIQQKKEKEEKVKAPIVFGKMIYKYKPP